MARSGYIPTSHFYGYDSFTYTASDGILTSSPATVNITVNDAAPTISNSPYYTVTHDHSLGVAAPGLLSGVSDADGDPFTLSIATQPAHGSVTINPDGSFSYVPVANYSGYDNFTYTASDGLRTSSPAMVGITVANIAPTAGGVSYSVIHDQTLTVTAPGLQNQVFDGDGDPANLILVSGPTHGILTWNGDGSFAYTPAHALLGYG